MNISTVEVIRYAGKIDDEFYWERMDRNLGWLDEIDEEARKRQYILKNSTIGIADAGEIGGPITSRLIRMGVSHVRVADLNTFNSTNIQRQVGADTLNLERNKAIVIEEMAHRISHNALIEVFPQGITDKTSVAFVDGCDIILDQIDIYAVDAHYTLYEAFRKSEKCKCIITALTIGHAAYIFKYTKNSMYYIEDIYDIPKRSSQDLNDDELRKLIGRIIPEQPDFPSRETFDRWWIRDRVASIWSSTSSLYEGILAERAVLELIDVPGAVDIPEQPGYIIFDTKNWNSKIATGVWWTNPDHPKED